MPTARFVTCEHAGLPSAGSRPGDCLAISSVDCGADGRALPVTQSGEGTGVSESVWPEPAKPRREPQQARSRARVAQILQAADAILTEEGSPP
jgi:hypothetical protein